MSVCIQADTDFYAIYIALLIIQSLELKDLLYSYESLISFSFTKYIPYLIKYNTKITFCSRTAVQLSS